LQAQLELKFKAQYENELHEAKMDLDLNKRLYDDLWKKHQNSLVDAQNMNFEKNKLKLEKAVLEKSL